ncbi:MAG: DUF881 domain-containing protein [Nocardioidaceae bacterium]
MSRPQEPSPEAAPPDRGATTRYAGLLTQVMTNTLDEDYQTVADRRTGQHSRRGQSISIVLVLGLFGALLGVSALETEQNRPEAAAERAQLVEQIHDREDHLDTMHTQLSDLQTAVADLRERVTRSQGTDQRISAEVGSLSRRGGAAAVKGPGVVITTDNAPNAVGSEGGGVILDTDLQALANGLWKAGAEAISIDGHRLTSLTAIRYAGRAITVDYRSLSPPYVVKAIGNPNTLPARLLETAGGQLWLGLKSNFNITFDTVVADGVVVQGDPHNRLRYAEAVGDR